MTRAEPPRRATPRRATPRRATPSRTLPAALAALLALACGAPDPAADPAPAEAAAVSATPVRSLPLEPRTVTETTVLSADLRPLRRATLAAEVAGRVEEVSAELGAAVGKGELLVAVDTLSLRQAVAEAEAVWRQAVDRHERAKSLFERRSITQQQLEDAAAQREVAAARLETARIALERSRVEAPWAGRVAERFVEVGDYAAPGQPLVELVQVDRLEVRAAAPADQARWLEVGRPVEIRVDALPGERFAGRIARLGAELDTASRTLGVEIELDNSGGRLRPGMFARVEIPLRDLEAALLVPLAAVVDFEEERVVYVVEEGRARRRAVVLGPVIGPAAVALEGLAPGDRLIVEGQQQVAEGQPVEEAADEAIDEARGGAER